jgi:hypothetical protein
MFVGFLYITIQYTGMEHTKLTVGLSNSPNLYRQSTSDSELCHSVKNQI